MNVESLQYIFIKILRSELTGTDLEHSIKEQLTPEVISGLYSLSKHHDLAHIVANALYKCGLLTNDELLKKFQKEQILSVYRNEQMKYVYNEICEIFEEANIKYIPLKGSVIRPYYPEESMRTSCDIDMLIQEENLDTAVEKLKAKGYQFKQKSYHDVSLFSPANIHLELHFNIFEDIESLDNVLKDAWQYAIPVQGCQLEFTKEFFLFHMFAHMSYHFLRGGCGVRSLMDVWVMEHKMGISYPQAKEFLKKANIYQFAEEISKLVDICFSDADGDVFYDTMMSYIVNGGVYGSLQNKIAVAKAKNNSSFLYMLKGVFLPYRRMILLYPTLKKFPILLPLYWIFRVLKKFQKALLEIKTVTNMSDDKVDTMKEIKLRLGL